LYKILWLLCKDLAHSNKEIQILVITRYNKASEAPQGDINTWVNKFKTGPLMKINRINSRLAGTSLLELKAIYQHLLNNKWGRY
jgi:hypothetical protein